jgi:hypothetical protein
MIKLRTRVSHGGEDAGLLGCDAVSLQVVIKVSKKLIASIFNHFNPKEGGDMFLSHVSNDLQNRMVSLPRRPQSKPLIGVTTSDADTAYSENHVYLIS